MSKRWPEKCRGPQRQLEGISKAKADGRYKGRKPSIDRQAVKQLKEQGLSADDIADALNVGRASVYRLIRVQ
jgi:DNA invertase Pin-like site-specific DNA recombinase